MYMKQSKKWISFFLVLALCLSVGRVVKAGEEKTKESGAALKLTRKTWKKTLKDKKGKVYLAYEYQYPFAGGSGKAAKRFNRFYQNARKKWLAGDKENAELAKDVWKASQGSVSCSDTVSCSITCQGKDYISVLQEGYAYTGGTHGMPYRMTAVFSTKTGKQVTAMKIMGKSKKELNKQVRKNFKKLFKQNPGEFYEKERFQDALKYDFAGKGKYYLTYDKDGSSASPAVKIRFYADVYQLAPYVEGYKETDPMPLK